jgi:redox-sensitive bicupin YhaK (pirin superfamily)
LPASEKMSAPGYQDIPTNLIPEVIDGNTLVRVLAGEYQGVQGPVKTQAIQPQFLDLHFGVNSNEDASTDSLTWPVDTSQNGFIYVYEGDVEVEGERLTKGQLGVLEFDGSVTVSSSVAAKAIVVSGTPIGEPIAQYGPFVMNTEEEIQQALRDYQSGALA